MKLLKTATLSIALLAAPAMAQSVSDTHELRWNQAGKIPTATYHPIKRNCGPTASPIHLAGKTPLIVHAKSSNCGTEVAAVAHNRSATELAENK
ncbi:MAG: hypothetical protein JWO15_2751 [Sphingomonadales bacterium]|nr:hypothetical protein [Sphingomonadales bacterium]